MWNQFSLCLFAAAHVPWCSSWEPYAVRLFYSIWLRTVSLFKHPHSFLLNIAVTMCFLFRHSSNGTNIRKRFSVKYSFGQYPCCRNIEEMSCQQMVVLLLLVCLSLHGEFPFNLLFLVLNTCTCFCVACNTSKCSEEKIILLSFWL